MPLATAGAHLPGERQVAHCGLAIHVAVAGSGPPLLLVMGIGGNSEMWAPLRAECPHLTTISYDAPGTGRSATPTRMLPMTELATIARRVAEATGHRQLDVLGYSFGGAIAQQLALQSPSLVRRLCLVATNAGAVSIPPTAHRLVQLMSTRRFESADYFKRTAPGLFGGRSARDPSVLTDEFHARHVAPPSRTGYWAQMAAIGTWTSLPWLRLVRQPTLILAGDDDRLVPVANARLLARGIPDARLHVLPDAGHLLLFDDAERAAVPIGDFLAG